MPSEGRERTSIERPTANWDRARLSVVVPIGIIVAVAILCIVVAVLSSAQRADEVAIDHERQLLSATMRSYGERVLREVASVATSDAAIANLRTRFDGTWAEQRVGNRLETFFNHDYVFIFDGNDQLAYSLKSGSQKARWLDATRADIDAVLAFTRGRTTTLEGAVRLNDEINSLEAAPMQVALFRRLLGRPVVIAAVAASPVNDAIGSSGAAVPIVMSVKFIDDAALAQIAGQLRLSNLREVQQGPVATGDFVYTLNASDGSQIIRFAWTPKQPGADIVHSVIPFIAVALAGFALLAAFVLRYMRRTAVAIAAGETRLRHLALHDPLCGLPNRIFFGDRLEALIEEVRGGGPAAAVLYVDLDHFKEVNDTLGHHVGDELIRNVTLRLSHTLRPGDLVARLGGDEFAVISGAGYDSVKAMAVAHRIIAAISAPYSINGQNIVIGASIGVTLVDRTCGAATDIMRYADMALYRAKNEGRNRACVYDAAMDADLSNRKLLENDLRDAIESDALNVVYQPIVSKNGETMLGVEALCRWTHPTRGAIEPGEFIAVAEHSGLIIALGNCVLRRACLEAKAWPGLTVAVNVSPLQFRRTDFVDIVERTLTETQFDPARLELELTESVLLGNGDSVEAAMHRLKNLGVRIALDDFGTGYSSLQYLRRYPFDKLKIDRSFVGSIEHAADAAAIVHAIVSLGRGLGMKVTAEGVETAEQQLFLRAAGVHSMQGYRFGRPVSAFEISRRLMTSAEPGKDFPTALTA